MYVVASVRSPTDLCLVPLGCDTAVADGDDEKQRECDEKRPLEVLVLGCIEPAICQSHPRESGARTYVIGMEASREVQL